MNRMHITEANGRRRRAAALLATLVAGALFAAAPGALAGDYSGTVLSTPSGNHPADANAPDPGNVVSGGDDSAVPARPRAAYGAGYPAATVYPQGRVAITPPHDGGYANVPDPGNVVNGPGWTVR